MQRDIAIIMAAEEKEMGKFKKIPAFRPKTP
jgi:hypothetical protein